MEVKQGKLILNYEEDSQMSVIGKALFKAMLMTMAIIMSDQLVIAEAKMKETDVKER